MKVANQQVGVSSALGFLPPPISYFTFVPELYSVVRGQLAMVVDIGHAMGKGEELNKDIVLGIYMDTLGDSISSAISIKGSKVIISKLNQVMLEQLAKMITNKLVLQLSQSLVSKLVPGLGSTFMAIWVRNSSILIGKHAENIYAKQLQLDSKEIIKIPAKTKNKAVMSAKDKELLLMESIRVFINLMNVDKVQHEKEYDNILSLIQNAQISASNKKALLKDLISTKKIKIDFSILNQLEDKFVLLLDLLAFCSIDGNSSESERKYIRQVSKSLKVDFHID